MAPLGPLLLNTSKVLEPTTSPETRPVSVLSAPECSAAVTSTPFRVTRACLINPGDCAPTVTVTGTLFANGGGGGEGGGGGRSGETGSDPIDYNARALGGNNNRFGGDGGNGSVFANAATSAASDSNGGGGGGGGAGRIKTYQAVPPTGKISPPAN